MTDIQATLDELHRLYLPVTDGRIADYIPELSKADPTQFGIALVTVDGKVYEAGASRSGFTAQSVSKPFVYGLALEDLGREAVHSKVGVEPTGQAFNSIIELEESSHRPFNPMINSGAIATSGLIAGRDSTERLSRILEHFARFTGRPVHVDARVFLSERKSGHRNRAIANLMRHFEVIGDDLDEILELYFQQCSIVVDTRDLAAMAATLANGGVHPVTGERALRSEHVRDVLALMFTCGMYDSAGEWAFTVGLPAKSGVSGGLIAVVPGRMGIAVSSPLLDSRGHSIRGVKVMQELARRWKLSMFEAGQPRGSGEIA